MTDIERRFVRTSDYGFTAHIWLVKGGHLHATGRTKLQALENVDAKLASYLASRAALDRRIS